MKYLTITEYAKMKHISYQAVQDRIRRGKLSLTKIKVDAHRIPVEDVECESVK